MFIGIDLDEDVLVARLDACEVHDVEGVLSGRRVFIDPLNDLDQIVVNEFGMIDDWGPPYPVKCN